MKIYLIRHGECEKSEDEPVLTKTGFKQAENVIEKLNSLKIDKFYSSDLKRCKQTCEGLLKSGNTEIEFDKKFREIYRLIIGGPEKPGTSEDREQNDKKRAEGVYSELLSLKQNTVIFTHGNLIRYLLGRVLGNIENMWNCVILPGSISILEINESEICVKAINIYDHQKEFLDRLYDKKHEEEYFE